MKKKVRKIGNFRKSLHFLISSKNFIIAAVIMFAAFFLLGLAYPNLMRDFVLDVISGMVGKIEGMNFFQLAGFIIFNNVKSSFLGMFIGLLFGIFPLFLAAINGYVLGFVMNLTIAQNGASEIWKIFPHGIFELPAFFFALGLGIRLGYTLFTNTKLLKQDLKMSLLTFVYIILPLLLIAGLIETGLIFLLKP